MDCGDSIHFPTTVIHIRAMDCGNNRHHHAHDNRHHHAKARKKSGQVQGNIKLKMQEGVGRGGKGTFRAEEMVLRLGTMVASTTRAKLINRKMSQTTMMARPNGMSFAESTQKGRSRYEIRLRNGGETVRPGRASAMLVHQPPDMHSIPECLQEFNYIQEHQRGRMKALLKQR